MLFWLYDSGRKVINCDKIEAEQKLDRSASELQTLLVNRVRTWHWCRSERWHCPLMSPRARYSALSAMTSWVTLRGILSGPRTEQPGRRWRDMTSTSLKGRNRQKVIKRHIRTLYMYVVKNNLKIMTPYKLTSTTTRLKAEQLTVY